MSIRSTHTYVVLSLSQPAYDEIAQKLRDADYGHCFMKNGDIDMHGIAVSIDQPLPNARPVKGDA